MPFPKITQENGKFRKGPREVHLFIESKITWEKNVKPSLMRDQWRKIGFFNFLIEKINLFEIIFLVADMCKTITFSPFWKPEKHLVTTRKVYCYVYSKIIWKGKEKISFLLSHETCPIAFCLFLWITNGISLRCNTIILKSVKQPLSFLFYTCFSQSIAPLFLPRKIVFFPNFSKVVLSFQKLVWRNLTFCCEVLQFFYMLHGQVD